MISKSKAQPRCLTQDWWRWLHGPVTAMIKKKKKSAIMVGQSLIVNIGTLIHFIHKGQLLFRSASFYSMPFGIHELCKLTKASFVITQIPLCQHTSTDCRWNKLIGWLKWPINWSPNESQSKQNVLRRSGQSKISVTEGHVDKCRGREREKKKRVNRSYKQVTVCFHFFHSSFIIFCLFYLLSL